MVDGEKKKIMRKLWLKRGRIGFLLSFLCLFVFMLDYKGYVRQIYQLLYDNFDTVYFFHKERAHFCCTVYQGGLGNLLFQYSFSYMLAKTLNLTLLVPNKDMLILQQVFQIPNVTCDTRGRRVCESTERFFDKIDVGFDESVFNIPNNTDIYYEGYFQSWVYWQNVEEELRSQIKFHAEIISEAEKLLDAALSEVGKAKGHVTLVGIHVRRGDMITNDYFKDYGYNVADDKYLAKAMKYIKDRVTGDIIYIVCSNDMKWTKQAIKDPNAVFINGTKREYDMAVLTLCDHFIMTVGTFGWWTGFLAKGMIIYYDTPFRLGTPLANNWAKDYQETFFYPGWIGMS